MKLRTTGCVSLLLIVSSMLVAQSITRCGGPTNELYINWPNFRFDVCQQAITPTNIRLALPTSVTSWWIGSTPPGTG